MVESVEAVSGLKAAESAEKIQDNNAVQGINEDFDKLDVSETQDVLHAEKLDISAIERLDVSTFESSLAVAIEKLEAIGVEGFGSDDLSKLTFALEQMMNQEQSARNRYVEWADMVKEMGQSGIDATERMTEGPMSTQEMMQHVQQSMNKNLEYQHMLEVQALELSVRIESMSWIRSIATALVKGTRRLITQT